MDHTGPAPTPHLRMATQTGDPTWHMTSHWWSWPCLTAIPGPHSPARATGGDVLSLPLQLLNARAKHLPSVVVVAELIETGTSR